MYKKLATTDPELLAKGKKTHYQNARHWDDDRKDGFVRYRVVVTRKAVWQRATEILYWNDVRIASPYFCCTCSEDATMEPQCTLYTHKHNLFGDLSGLLKQNFKKAKIEEQQEGGFKVASITAKAGFFKPKFQFKIAYRQRETPSNTLVGAQCDLSQDLRALIQKSIRHIPNAFAHQEVISRIEEKIQTVNAELVIHTENGSSSHLMSFLKHLAGKLNALVLVYKESELRDEKTAVILSENFNKVIDFEGDRGNGVVFVITDAAFRAKRQNSAEQVSKELEEKKQADRMKQLDAFFRENASPEAFERKKTSETHLTRANIKVNYGLPVYEDSGEVQLRSIEEIVKRAFAIEMVVLAANELSSAEVKKRFASYTEFLSPKELDFLNKPNPSNEDKSLMTYRVAALDMLNWTLGLVENIQFLPSFLGSQLEFHVLEELFDDVVAKCKLRSIHEILNQADLSYRLFWAARDAQIRGEIPTEFDGHLVYETYYAMKWITSQDDWDHVDMST